MVRVRFNKLYLTAVSIMLSFLFIAGDCGTDTNDPPNPSNVGAPSNVRLSLDASSGGSSFATVTWQASSSQGTSGFGGYKVVTFRLDSSNNIVSVFDSSSVGSTQNSYNVFSVQRGTRYRTYVSAFLSDGTRSDSVSTPVYGGIYYVTGVSIDEYQTAGPSQSGFGWNPSGGGGAQYSFNFANAPFIDLHLRDDGSGLKFYSPEQFEPGQKISRISLIGTGETAFNQSNLSEPSQVAVLVDTNSVYLLKTEENNYVKIWVRSITGTSVGQNRTVNFDYKIQPISGIRILKR